MYSVLCFGLLFTGLVCGVDDFFNEYHGYNFIYHDNHDLLLVTNSTDCYYVQILNFIKGHLSEGFLRDAAERDIVKMIEETQDASILPTTMETMSSKYRDLLADFHCLHKHVFEVTSIEDSSGFHG